MKAIDYVNIKTAENELNKLNKIKIKKQNRISRMIEIDDFMGENNFWTFMLPASIGIILAASMLLAQTFSPLVSVIAGGLIFFPGLFNIAIDNLKRKNISDNQKLEKQIRTSQYKLESLKTQEDNKVIKAEIQKDKLNTNNIHKKNKDEIKDNSSSNKEDELNML